MNESEDENCECGWDIILKNTTLPIYDKDGALIKEFKITYFGPNYHGSNYVLLFNENPRKHLMTLEEEQNGNKI